jgi:fucose 4-O-acetylase-like acetyltransferase
LNNRHNWADTAKAIGMLLVVYGHTARGLQSAGLGIDHGTFGLVDSVLYSFHMPLFFFISGFFLPDSLERKGPADFMRTKVDSIVYPYVVWSLLQGSIEAGLSKYTNGAISFVDVLSLAWAPRAQFWFLYALFLIFALVAIAYVPLKKRTYPILAVVALALYIFASNAPLPFGYVAQNMVFLMAGTLMGKMRQRLIQTGPVALFVLGAAFVLSQYYFHAVLRLTYRDRGWASLALACIAILFVIHVSAAIKGRLQALLCYVGAASMSIYILHILFTSGVRIVMAKVLHNHNPVAHLIAGTVIGMGAPLLIHEFIRRRRIQYVFSAPISRMIWPSPRHAIEK